MTCAAALAIVPFTAAADLDPVQEDAVLALARLYGAVRYFHPGDAGQRVAWDGLLVDATGRALEVRDASQIGPLLRTTFAESFAGIEIARSPVPAAAPAAPASGAVAWHHGGVGIEQGNNLYRSWRTGRDPTPKVAGQDPPTRPLGERGTTASFPLAAGWHARIPLVLSSADALVTPKQNEAIERQAAALAAWNPAASESVTRAQSVAVAIALWSIARHFYPYWEVVKVDWDAELKSWARTQPESQSRDELRRALRRLAARLEDGHVTVVDDRLTPGGLLPIALRPLGDTFVVTASDVDEVRVGDVVTSFNGKPIAEVLRDSLAMAPGGAHARQWRARGDLIGGRAAATAELGLQRGEENVQAILTYASGRRELNEKRPDPIAELRPGIFYVDLTRLARAAFATELPRLKTAKAVIFDMRGYPTGDARSVVSLWMSGSDEARWMHVPFFDRPFEGPVAYQHLGWGMQKATELEGARKILLIDPRAISYAESLTGYFAAHARGVMIGEPTYGANGDVSRVKLPGGFGLRFTGMDVTTHDGRTRFHAKGFQPDIPVLPTLEGIRAGRDEVLERALEVAARE